MTGTADMTYSRYCALAALVHFGALYRDRPSPSGRPSLWRSIEDGLVPVIGTASREEEVRRLVEEGLAEAVSYDPVFVSGKIVPTEGARTFLEQHPPTEAMDGVGVHVEHCCRDHGCKYGHRFCPVETGSLGQRYPCEACDEERRWTEETLGEMSDRDLVQELESRGYEVRRSGGS